MGSELQPSFCLTCEMPNWKIAQRIAVRRSCSPLTRPIFWVSGGGLPGPLAESEPSWSTLVLGGRGHREVPGTTVIDLANGIGNAGAGIARCCRNQYAGIYKVEEVLGFVIIGPRVVPPEIEKLITLAVALD